MRCESRSEIVEVVLPHRPFEHFFDHRRGSKPGNESCPTVAHRDASADAPPPARMRFRSRSRTHRVGRVGRPGLGPDGECSRRSRCFAVRLQDLPHIFFLALDSFHDSRSALRLAQRGSVDVHRVAVMPHPTQQRIHHRFVAEKVLPLVIHQDLMRSPFLCGLRA